jgi:hypothetical protein
MNNPRFIFFFDLLFIIFVASLVRVSLQSEIATRYLRAEATKLLL